MPTTLFVEKDFSDIKKCTGKKVIRSEGESSKSGKVDTSGILVYMDCNHPTFKTWKDIEKEINMGVKYFVEDSCYKNKVNTIKEFRKDD